MSGIDPTVQTWILAREGGYSDDPGDAGNWTGGEPGSGELKGTKYGISAASYPGLDIAALTIEDALEVYKVDYWDAYRCGELPPAAGLCLFDAVVQHRPETAVRLIQRPAGAAVDGIMGPNTIAAVQRTPMARFIPDHLAQRLELYADITTGNSRMRQYLYGWFRRVMLLDALVRENGLVDGAEEAA